MTLECNSYPTAELDTSAIVVCRSVYLQLTQACTGPQPDEPLVSFLFSRNPHDDDEATRFPLSKYQQCLLILVNKVRQVPKSGC